MKRNDDDSVGSIRNDSFVEDGGREDGDQEMSPPVSSKMSGDKVGICKDEEEDEDHR